ncbi:MAG: lipid-A-disaccharide synthase N-terminal domain-containing protein [Rhodomicrobium sp.]
MLYAIHKVDPVFMLGQGLGLGIYARNIYFIWRHKRQGETPEALKAAE